MNILLDIITKDEKYCEFIEKIQDKKGPLMLSGLTDVAKVLLTYGIVNNTKKPICIITHNEIQAKKLETNFKYFTDRVAFFPKREIVTYDYVAENMDLPYARIDILNKIHDKKLDVIITTIEAIMQKMLSPKELYKNVIKLEVQKTFKLEKLKEKLINLGYERCQMTESKGQFALRGGIVDIAISEKKGIRVEFWGDDIDSIRYFNLSDQRSIEMAKEVTIYPNHEFLLGTSKQEICNQIQEKYLKDDIKEKNKAVIEADIEQILNSSYISKIDKYFNEFYEEQESFLDYIKENYAICIDEVSKITNRAQNIEINNRTLAKSMMEKDKMVPEAITNTYVLNEVTEKIKKYQTVYLEIQEIGHTNTYEKVKKENTYTFDFRELNFSKNTLEIFFKEAKEAKAKRRKVIVLAGNEARAKKINNLLLDQEIPSRYEEKLKKVTNDGEIVVTTGAFSNGFDSKDFNLIVITGEELLEKGSKKKKKVSTLFKQGEKVVFADLRVGDYIVHKTNGIGQFIGVNTIKADGIIKDYIKIRYKGDDILYVPTNQLDNVRKYVGAGDSLPKLNKLGSRDWEKTKNKVKSNLREVARNLIELYAKRQKAKGFAFSKDTVWQKQFEENFPYIETDDQLRCIEEMKKDMERERPMDRLLCGDVGYGKTEVAIRGAFKAVMDGKQVAYLVPTTVLASQQYESFKKRMEEFGVNVELLNRFRSKKDQDEIIRKLKLGEIDVLIGTHRIISKDVEFRDLGLLIIDEEHRFGVKAKEKIKELKSTVDVLTMTATPIPRTLHMSVVGIRDMSVIYEPPQNRKPVQTYVLEYDAEIIKEALTREIEKDGQAFYLFNNVENIEKKAAEIEELVPEARVVYAHGKMTGSQLEEIMQDFIDHKIDILVCTTILESGIDIPNANTIIVENADRLGLAQLYQIRGRVGRSDVQGYAYITYRRDKMLSEEADKRLKAIKEFTEFGSGFKIAMRDLEIRGAGSLVGEIQHGHLEQVGYETYCNLLDEVVRELQGIEIKEEPNIQIDLDVSSYIPDEFIDNSSQKIEIYQNISLCQNEEDIKNVIDEIIDRYGNMPEEIENLIQIARIKILAKKRNVTKITQKGDRIIFNFIAKEFNFEELTKLIKEYKNKIQFSPSGEPYITYKLDSLNDKKILKEVKEFLGLLGDGSLRVRN